MFIVGGASNLIGVIGFLIEAAIAVLIIVFLIKGIKHFNRKVFIQGHNHKTQQNRANLH